ncbi:AfsR/SARP family transcriptional regulator [Streptomyces albus]|uniref:AfsR/SARP family transcriptional regulator n=1 Tax=Streptomyces albus TaxID=1888 RepID=UPI00378AD251
MVIFVALGSPLELWVGDEQFPLGPVKQRCVLAVLLHARGRAVAVDTLIDRVWDGDPPLKAAESLHTYVSRLRGILQAAVGDSARIDHLSPRRYRLLVADDEVDLHLFQQLRQDAAAAAGRGEHALATGMLSTAESMWRGEPFAEFTGDWGCSVRARLQEDLRSVREERLRLGLELGQHAELLGELHQLAAQYPLGQRTVGLLMTALYRCGRTDEALGHYRAVCRRLRDEQGIEPGPGLRELHARILAQDSTLLGARGTPRTPARPAPAPNERPRNNLPRDVRDFVGRDREMRLLADRPDGPGQDAAPAVTVIHGMPGIGKTVLALHAAHQLAPRYPDGVFHVDLRGYSEQPYCEPFEALGLLLTDAQAPYDPSSRSLDERTRRWREWTARHTALLLLDDARDVRQVTPLLPVAPGCRVIVTSRKRLHALEGAGHLPLKALPEDDAVSLFVRIAGSERAPEGAELRRAVGVIGGHPFFLRLAASGFRHRETWDLPYLTSRLEKAPDLLDEVDDDALAATFRLSYVTLGDAAQRLLRRLALHPGPDLPAWAVPALTGLDEAAGRRALKALLDNHLVEEPSRERYAVHALTRAFGRQMCAEEDTPHERRAAVERLLDHYLVAADRADRAAHPRRRRLPLLPPPNAPCAPRPAGAEEATAWLMAERANLLAVTRMALDHVPATGARFPHVLAQAFRLWAVWDTAAELHGAAARALRTGNDTRALAQALTEWADVTAQSAPDSALERATEAITLFDEAGDQHGSAVAHFQAARARLAAGQRSETLRELAEALRRFRACGDAYGEAEALNVEGVALHYGGAYEEALARFRRVFDLHARVGDAFGEATALNNIGEIFCLEGRYDEARHYYEEALVRVRAVGGPLDVALEEGNLGTVHQATGDTERALACYRRALACYRESGDAVGEADTLVNLGSACAASRRFGEAMMHVRMAERVAREVGNVYEHQRAVTGRGDVQRLSGRLDAARASYEAALAMARGADFTLGAAHALHGLARTALLSGSADAARRYGAEALGLYTRLEATAECRALRQLLGEMDGTG